jgi:hypothetical protein
MIAAITYHDIRALGRNRSRKPAAILCAAVRLFGAATRTCCEQVLGSCASWSAGSTALTSSPRGCELRLERRRSCRSVKLMGGDDEQISQVRNRVGWCSLRKRRLDFHHDATRHGCGAGAQYSGRKEPWRGRSDIPVCCALSRHGASGNPLCRAGYLRGDISTGSEPPTIEIDLGLSRGGRIEALNAWRLGGTPSTQRERLSRRA